MKVWLICWIVFALTACSSTPLQLPTCDIPGPSPVVQMPLELPRLPQAASSTDTTATYPLEEVRQLKRYRLAADANFKVAQSNALALEARNDEVNNLIECSMYSKIWMEVREDMLEQERRDHFMDNLYHRGLIALGLIATAVL